MKQFDAAAFRTELLPLVMDALSDVHCAKCGHGIGANHHVKLTRQVVYDASDLFYTLTHNDCDNPTAGAKNVTFEKMHSPNFEWELAKSMPLPKTRQEGP